MQADDVSVRIRIVNRAAAISPACLRLPDSNVAEIDGNEVGLRGRVTSQECEQIEDGVNRDACRTERRDADQPVRDIVMESAYDLSVPQRICRPTTIDLTGM